MGEKNNTLIGKIKLEHEKIMRGRNGVNFADIAKRYASGAYLALELGWKKKANKDISRSDKSYRDGMVATTSEKFYGFMENERGTVNNLPTYYLESGKHWGTPREKDYAKDISKFLGDLRSYIDPRLIDLINGQKEYLHILSGQEGNGKDLSSRVEVMLSKLFHHREHIGRLPNKGFPGIIPNIDGGYDLILASCSEKGSRDYRLEKPESFNNKFQKMKNITGLRPSEDMTLKWVKDKMERAHLQDISTILQVIGVRERDHSLDKIFEEYLPEVKRTTRTKMTSVSDISHDLLKNKQTNWSTGGGIGRYNAIHVMSDKESWYGCSGVNASEYFKALGEFLKYPKGVDISCDENSTTRKIRGGKVTMERYTTGFGVTIEKGKIVKKGSSDGSGTSYPEGHYVWCDFLHHIWPKK